LQRFGLSLCKRASRVHQHRIVAIKCWPRLLSRDSSPATGKELSPDFGGDLLVPMAKEKVQEGFSLVFGNYE
jgi:hypothetical protein